ncbi:MAG TPA: GNAT family N-acetyltransferase [Clostridia bacterium]|jgi:ribosomal protein S18 acetylase RimI-like enzyme|nr:GNAT family N-acetyltransferase [Clostridia bacterium]HPQ46714.1 GNAT family N-acetyltransferase [Clostridia bacterium]HRX41893.1 GNAT family N-acetyltransferase [Clostridia bacterium]
MPVYSFTVKKARPEDADDIKGILNEAFTKYMKDTGLTGSMEALEETREQIIRAIEETEVFIAHVNGVAVGTIRFEISGDEAHISRFGVRLDYHNIGIGKSLMNLVDAEMIALGIKRAYLYSASAYTDLIRFYYSRGFYIESTSTDRGYVRAKLVKEYKNR